MGGPDYDRWIKSGPDGAEEEECFASAFVYGHGDGAGAGVGGYSGDNSSDFAPINESVFGLRTPSTSHRQQPLPVLVLTGRPVPDETSRPPTSS